MTSAEDSRLEASFERAQAQGFLGKGSTAKHILHARAHASVAFREVVLSATPTDDQDTRTTVDQSDQIKCLDLGAGGGVPGLVIAFDHSTITMTLLERSDRRCEFLTSEVLELGLSNTVNVVCADAAEAAHDEAHRENYDFVLSRSFGRPCAVAECGAGLVIPGGELVVSEPPTNDPARWPTGPLAELGFELSEITTSMPHFAVLRKTDLCPVDVPRQWNKIVKQPLY